MKVQENTRQVTVIKMSDSQRERLTLIAEKLKGRDLFPEKTEAARNILKKVKFKPH